MCEISIDNQLQASSLLVKRLRSTRNTFWLEKIAELFIQMKFIQLTEKSSSCDIVKWIQSDHHKKHFTDRKSKNGER